MVKITTHITIKKEYLDFFRKIGKPFSEWIEEKIEEEYFSEKKLLNELEKAEKKLEGIKNTLEEHRKKIKPQNLEETKELLESKEILKSDPKKLFARLSRYINIYNKPHITEEEFINLLEEIKK